MPAPALFHRLDDAGKDDAVTAFCEALVGDGIPLAVAVVPEWLTGPQKRRLARLVGLTILQHGYRHVNRRRFGYPDEFPDAMRRRDVIRQIHEGRRRLEDAFSRPVETYVPPWNKISRRACTALIDLGFAAVSGHMRFPVPSPLYPVSPGGLKGVHVSVDTARGYEPLRIHALSTVTAAIATEHCDPIGVLYHVDGLPNTEWRRVVSLAGRLARTYPAISLGEVLARHAG